MKLIFMGTPDFAAEILEAVIRGGHEVTCVVTQPDKPVGRSGRLRATPVKETALKYGIPVLQPERVREDGFARTLDSYEAEVIVVAAFGQIIPRQILDMKRYGCLNVHASLLPDYRGAAPIQWAVIDGRDRSGVTLMQMGEGLDTGDMLAFREYRLAADETGGSLFEGLSRAGAELLVEFLNEADREGEGAFHPVAQPKESPTPYARMICKEDGRIDWSAPAVRIERLVRGMDPWPSAYTFLRGKMLKIWRSEVETETGIPDRLPAGGVAGADDAGLRVRTGEGILRITELQLEGKKRMDAGTFLRGNSVPEGEVLGN